MKNDWYDEKTDEVRMKPKLTESEFRIRNIEREKRELERINQPLDLEWLKSQGLIVENEKKSTECEVSERGKDKGEENNLKNEKNDSVD